MLVDVGASGDMNGRWKQLAPYAVCICFDPDEREFNVHNVKDSGFKKLIKVNRAVVCDENGITKFYLTRSPYCSSTLKPLANQLKPWLFKSYFDVIDEVNVSTTTLENALCAAGVTNIDWLKFNC